MAKGRRPFRRLRIKINNNITEEFYTIDYESSEWYNEFVNIVGNSEFLCRPVKHSYADLVDAISDVSLGGISKQIMELGCDTFSAGINDYLNVVEVEIQGTEKKAVTDILNKGIYSVSFSENRVI